MNNNKYGENKAMKTHLHEATKTYSNTSLTLTKHYYYHRCKLDGKWCPKVDGGSAPNLPTDHHTRIPHQAHPDKHFASKISIFTKRQHPWTPPWCHIGK